MKFFTRDPYNKARFFCLRRHWNIMFILTYSYKSHCIHVNHAKEGDIFETRYYWSKIIVHQSLYNFIFYKFTVFLHFAKQFFNLLGSFWKFKLADISSIIKINLVLSSHFPFVYSNSRFAYFSDDTTIVFVSQTEIPWVLWFHFL